MSTTLSTGRSKEGTVAGQDPSAVLVEGLFAFVVKGAKRIVQLSKRELGTLKELAVTFAEAPEEERTEILETILEVLLPEERIGGISDGEEVSKEARDKVDGCRLFIGDKIRKSRQKLGWTQKQLAAEAGIPQSHVSRLERGMHAPTIITIERLAKALQVAPGQLDPGYPETDG